MDLEKNNLEPLAPKSEEAPSEDVSEVTAGQIVGETSEEASAEVEEKPVEETVISPNEDAENPEGNPELPAEAPKKNSLQALMKKWWFWLIVVLVVGGIVTGIVLASQSSGSCSGSSGSSSTSSYVDPYVTLVKTARNSTYGITYGSAFDSFFTSPRWRSFTATTGQTVVEFTGGFLYSGSPATATFQFVLDFANNQMSVEYLSINGEAQSRLMLSVFLEKIFESY